MDISAIKQLAVCVHWLKQLWINGRRCLCPRAVGECIVYIVLYVIVSVY